MIVTPDSDLIRSSVGDGADFGVSVTYIVQDEPLGLTHCVLIARDFLGDAPFLMYLGDNVMLDGVAAMVNVYRHHPCSAQVSVVKADPREGGLAVLAPDGRVTRVEEKPKYPEGDLALMGVYVFSRDVHDAVLAIEPSARGELEITDAIAWLIEADREVRGFEYQGFWRDTGLVGTLLECNHAALNGIRTRIEGKVDDESAIVGRVAIGSGAQVTRSRLVGPLVIGAGSTVDGSFIGPHTAVGDNCTFEDAGVTYSIVMSEAVIRDVRDIHGSLIGERATVTSLSQVTPAGHRLVLGESTSVGFA